MSSEETEMPEGRCGFVLEPEDVPDKAQNYPLETFPLNDSLWFKTIQDYIAGSDRWYEATTAACCWREVWGDADDGRCLWHAKTDKKPAHALVDARANRSERLDGAYVPTVELGDTISFEKCRMWAATFDGTDLREASFAEIDGRFAQFYDADLRWTEFLDAELSEAQFPGSDLWFAQFPDADLANAQFHDADLRQVQFPDAELPNALFPGADLRGTQFSGADLEEAQFLDADLADANFSGAHLPHANFSGIRLRRTVFSNADLWEVQFSDADLEAAEFPDADLRGTQFTGADLTDADLTNADATGVTFASATLESATLRDADLSEADFTDAHLYDTHLLDVRINEGTEFSNFGPDEIRATRFTPLGVPTYLSRAATTATTVADQIDYDARHRPTARPLHRRVRDRLSTLPVVRHLHDKLQPKCEAARRWWFWYRTDRDTLDLPYEDLGKANTVYRTIQRLYRENSMPRRIDTYHVRARDTRRKQAIIDGDLGRWAYLAGQRWVMGYGERPWRVVGTSVGVVLASTLGYLVAGPFARTPAPEDATIVGGHLLTAVPVTLPGWLAEVLTSLYFSVVTFTTLGYGDLQPASGVAQTIATVESFVGALLMALLVFVLGRRTGR